MTFVSLSSFAAGSILFRDISLWEDRAIDMVSSFCFLLDWWNIVSVRYLRWFKYVLFFHYRPFSHTTQHGTLHGMSLSNKTELMLNLKVNYSFTHSLNEALSYIIIFLFTHSMNNCFFFMFRCIMYLNIQNMRPKLNIFFSYILYKWIN